MSKADDFLDECRKNLEQWVCSLHTTGSNQPAAIFREVKKRGYEFEEVSPNRWAKRCSALFVGKRQPIIS